MQLLAEVRRLREELTWSANTTLAEIHRLRAENERLRLGIPIHVGPAQADWLSVAMKTYAAQETARLREALARLVVVCDACLFERNYLHQDATSALKASHVALGHDQEGDPG